MRSLTTNKLLMVTLLICGPFFQAKVGAQNQLPQFEATDLNGEDRLIPDDFFGRKILLGFAFSNQVQDALQTWIEPIYYEMIDSTSLGSMVYDTEVLLVICFNKANVNFKKKVESELKENVFEECFPNVVLTDSDGARIAELLGVKDIRVPHLFAIDPSGKISYHTSGKYSEGKFDKLSSFLEYE
ncbi:MAG: hypothetical protein RIC15_03940 [Vicingaceae bacterium]